MNPVPVARSRTKGQYDVIGTVGTAETSGTDPAFGTGVATRLALSPRQKSAIWSALGRT